MKWLTFGSPNEAEYLFIIGIGDAYSGLIHLFNNNGSPAHLSAVLSANRKPEHCTDSIDFIFSFVAENVLQSVRRQTDDYVSDWYYKVRPAGLLAKFGSY